MSKTIRIPKGKTTEVVKIDFVKQGKKNKAAGARFELKVRKDMESKGWIVAKWMNNVLISGELERDKDQIPYGCKFKFEGKCIQAKQGRFRRLSTGFPDFICYISSMKNNFIMDFIECKSNGYLSKEEKEKAQWYLDNNYCSKFLIASKGKKRGEIIYKEFTNE